MILFPYKICFLPHAFLLQSFKAMIESKYSLVFVLVPGIQEFLKQHSRSDETCKMIRKAIQVITN